MPCASISAPLRIAVSRFGGASTRAIGEEGTAQSTRTGHAHATSHRHASCVRTLHVATTILLHATTYQ